MSAMNAWTDERIDDFMERYREDRDDTRATLQRIEQKVDARRWSPTLTVALFGPMSVALIGSFTMVITRGAAG